MVNTAAVAAVLAMNERRETVGEGSLSDSEAFGEGVVLSSGLAVAFRSRVIHWLRLALGAPLIMARDEGFENGKTRTIFDAQKQRGQISIRSIISDHVGRTSSFRFFLLYFFHDDRDWPGARCAGLVARNVAGCGWPSGRRCGDRTSRDVGQS